MELKLLCCLIIVLGAQHQVHSIAPPGKNLSTLGHWSVTEATGNRRYRPGELIFSDEFNSFNFDTWQHEISLSGGGNDEFQMYVNSRANSYVKDGKLCIKPTLTADVYGEEFLTSGNLDFNGGHPADRCTDPRNHGCYRRGTPVHIINPVMSARISTPSSFAFKYGKIEISAKLPQGDWLWPGIWLLPQHNEYGKWLPSGEIDMVEGRGNLKLRSGDNATHLGVEQISTTLHFGPSPYPPFLNGQTLTETTKNLRPGEGFHERFHKFSMLWTPDEMVFYLNDQEYYRVQNNAGGFWERGVKRFGSAWSSQENPWRYSTNQKMAPFDKKFYLILNLAVGGGASNYFHPGLISPKPRPWKTHSTQALLEFWKAKHDWYPTWKGEDSALQVDYIRNLILGGALGLVPYTWDLKSQEMEFKSHWLWKLVYYSWSAGTLVYACFLIWSSYDLLQDPKATTFMKVRFLYMCTVHIVLDDGRYLINGDVFGQHHKFS